MNTLSIFYFAMFVINEAIGAQNLHNYNKNHNLISILRATTAFSFGIVMLVVGILNYTRLQ